MEIPSICKREQWIPIFLPVELMEILQTLTPPRSFCPPCGLTIGSFDGVHLGHQQLLRYVRKKVGPQGSLCVLTFSNHPSHILPNREPLSLISSPEDKLHYLQSYGVDIVYLLPFTLELAQLSYEQFLHLVKDSYPFELLVLGEGATLGKKREGTSETIAALGKKLQFSVEYLPKYTVDGEIVSSGKIRECLQKGDLAKAKRLLGHPLSS